MGSHKQPLRSLSFPHTSRRKHQRKRRRRCCDTRPLGCEEMPLLHCKSPSTKRRRSSPHRRPRIQSPSLRCTRWQRLPNRPLTTPRYTRGHPRRARTHESHVGSIQRLRSSHRSTPTMGRKCVRKRRARIHSPTLVPRERRPTSHIQTRRIRFRSLRRNKRWQDSLHSCSRNEIVTAMADGIVGMRLRLRWQSEELPPFEFHQG